MDGFHIQAIVLVVVLAASWDSSHGSVAAPFPLFTQCNSSWGQNEMGVPGQGERATICKEGCAMSSLSMALNGLGIMLPENTAVNPGTLNKFLVENSLYVCAAGDCNNLVLSAVEAFTPRLKSLGEPNKPALAILQQQLLSGDFIFLAHVHNKGHFVLLTGQYEGTSFSVRDPFFPSTSYPYANISDVIQYEILKEERTINVPTTYPLYKQCDKRWGSDLIVTETVCAVGCLMSSISMALGGHGVSIEGKESNPGTLNEYMKTHKGYTKGNDLEESVVPSINPQRITWPNDGMHTSNDLSIDTVRAYLLKNRTVIANVMEGHHFVLCIGFDYKDPDTILVNDPGFNKTSYSYKDDVVGWRLFDIA